MISLHQLAESELPVSFVGYRINNTYSCTNDYVVRNSSVLRKYQSPQDRLSACDALYVSTESQTELFEGSVKWKSNV
ncbi:hypothetical protein M378DRAFT_87463 [Amanita muscaria Koide BX008]|uniref:Uncharacterized protein n=1 Tax=Amanita muscaria (strain Koide BX008) TaxID=946122 RepID=A0A0C2SUK6_AMAMK|nr:hypothetical protein M378DRAFT_87463 [Amanita muscaria Koide BX008]